MDRGQRIAAIALSFAPCSARDTDNARFATLMVRPSEETTTAARAYYLQNPKLSTCALAVLGFWRLAGCLETECVAPYYPGRVGMAFQDIEGLAARFGAWEGGVTGPLRAGDAFVLVDDAGGDAHVGTVVVDQAFFTDPVKTVEGGQFDGRGSTAVGAFTRAIRREGAGSGAVWKMGNRHVLGVVRAAGLPVPDDIVTD